MTITTLTSLELNQDVSRARNAALQGPVFITDQGSPAHVLLSIQEYQRLTGRVASIADLLAMPGAEAVELEIHPYPKGTETARGAVPGSLLSIADLEE